MLILCYSNQFWRLPKLWKKTSSILKWLEYIKLYHFVFLSHNAKYFNETFKIKTIHNFSNLAYWRNITQPHNPTNPIIWVVQQCFYCAVCFVPRIIACLHLGIMAHLSEIDVSVLRTFYFIHREGTSELLLCTLRDPIITMLLGRKICAQGVGKGSSAFCLIAAFLLIIHVSWRVILGIFDGLHGGQWDHLQLMINLPAA